MTDTNRAPTAPMTLTEFCAAADRIGLKAETLAQQLAARPEFADCLPSTQSPMFYASPEQANALRDRPEDSEGGVYLPLRKTSAGKFTMPLYAAAIESESPAVVGPTRDAIQKKALEHGFEYWRASDAHGVEATRPQAVELLQDLLGVEVEIKDNGCTTCNGAGMIGGPSFSDPGEGGEPCPDCCAHPVAAPSAALDERDIEHLCNELASIARTSNGGGLHAAITARVRQTLMATPPAAAPAKQEDEPDLIARGMTWDNTVAHMREACAQAGVPWNEDTKPKALAINVMQRLANNAHKTGFRLALERIGSTCAPEAPAVAVVAQPVAGWTPMSYANSSELIAAFKAGTAFDLHYHRQAKRVTAMGHHISGYVAVCGGKMLPVIVRCDGFYNGAAPIWLSLAASPSCEQSADAAPTAAQIEAAAKTIAACMDYPWEHMPEQGREGMRRHARTVAAALAAIQPTEEKGRG